MKLLFETMPVQAAGGDWWDSALVGVLVGGSIVTATQIILHMLSSRGEMTKQRARLQASSRALRDDMRAVEARMAIAIRDGHWWGNEDSVPPLHTGDDVRRIASAITDPSRWGSIAIGRRTVLRVEARRAAGKPFDPDSLGREFWIIERARAMLAKDIEGFVLDRIEWAKTVEIVYPEPSRK